MISNKLSKAIRQARMDGHTYLEICKIFDVSMTTARYHSDIYSAEKIREYERARYQRDRQDPEKVERKKEYIRNYRRRIAEEGRNLG